MKKKILFSTLLVSTLITSCGDSSSNPLEKYKGLKAVPANDEKAVVQTVVKPDLFMLQVQGTNQINTGQFVEGELSTILFKITPKSLAITDYVVSMIDFSNLNRPVLRATSTIGVYSLSWLAPVGTIPGGGWGATFQAQIQVTVKQATNQLLIGTTSTKTLDVVVSRNSAQPKLVGRTDLSHGVDEDQDAAFSVDVMDPNSATNPRLPEIQVTPYMNSNTEAYRADGSRYLVFDDKRNINPEKISANVFRFYYLLKVDHLPLDRDRMGKEIPSAADVDMCFLLRAVSGIGTLSDQQQICTKARYAAQPPVISFLEPSEIKAGHETTLTIQISSAHPLSVVSLAKSSLIIASLTGKKEITCNFDQGDKKNSQVCVVKWTPACVSQTAILPMTVKAESTLTNKTKSSSTVKNLTVLPDLEACPVIKSMKGTK